MCGRTSCSWTPSALLRRFHVHNNAMNDANRFTPCYNLGPKSFSPVLHLCSSKNSGRTDTKTKTTTDSKDVGPAIVGSLTAMFWGFEKSFGASEYIINARSESVLEKPSFSSLFRENRCIILADGYFEWKKQEPSGVKQPYFIHRKGNTLMMLAGLYQRCATHNAYAVITTQASDLVKNIHHRMPVIIENDQIAFEWLNEFASEASHFMKPFSGDLVMVPVSSFVNNVRNVTKECIMEGKASTMGLRTPSSSNCAVEIKKNSKQKDILSYFRKKRPDNNSNNDNNDDDGYDHEKITGRREGHDHVPVAKKRKETAVTDTSRL